MMTAWDLLTVGRVGMDLFAEQVGVPFAQIDSFVAHVGGSPANIAVAASRLGLKTAVLTAVSPDPVGDFVLTTLNREGVDTRFVQRKPGTRTGLAVLGVQPPDHFPLVFYRDNPADIHLVPADIQTLSLADFQIVLLSGTALSRGTMRDVVWIVAEKARQANVPVFLDLDLRPDQWSHPAAFGLNIRRLLPLVDVVIGTEAEMAAALAVGTVAPEALLALVEEWVKRPFSPDVFILKLGAQGAVLLTPTAVISVPGFPVTVLNTVGAGDAFAGGVIYGRLQGWSWPESVRFGNACGALVVTRHGCAAAMPTREELDKWIGENKWSI
ncbi:MAG: 5-dehydro-2-deoxygluconokinase [Chloroflexi bacterium]|nr:MAG: 5-dehydro-2-deoxygluconokinase [Chloroflexota bacterium]